MRRICRVALTTLGITGLTAASAFAHTGTTSRLADDGSVDSGKEVHAHHDAQHGPAEGHLAPTNRNVDLVGKLDLYANDDQDGRIGDVSAKDGYAYLALYDEPTCDRGGIKVIDLDADGSGGDPMFATGNMEEVAEIPSHLDTYAGEGSQVLRLTTPSFTGNVLLYNNEICGGGHGVGGVTIVDVRNPRRPKKLVEGFGDFTVAGKSQTHANQIHSAFAWNQGDKAYAVLVDDEELADVDIIDITNPSRPKFVADYDLVALSGGSILETPRPHNDDTFNHDMVVKRIGQRYVMLVSYWDGGYVELDVTNPAAATVIGDTDFGATDPFQTAFTPEGNAHQAEFTADNSRFIAADEDFDAFRVIARVEPNGPEFSGAQPTNTVVITDDPATHIDGPTKYVGRACGTVAAAPSSGTVAVAERGTCDFQVKADNVLAAGYSQLLVFNRAGTNNPCEDVVSMIINAPTLRALFLPRSTGMAILGLSYDPATCSTTTENPETVDADGQSNAVSMTALFDGWGYVHLYRAGAVGGKLGKLDDWALAEGQMPCYAKGYGDLSVHEVATDPLDSELVYLSHYAAGFRVLAIDGNELEEVGRFVAPEGNNFWGVETYRHDGETYVLASDRDAGVWVFQYDPRGDSLPAAACPAG